MVEVRPSGKGAGREHPDEITRPLLAPRPLGAPGPTAKPARARARRSRWRLRAITALLVAVAAVGKWLWASAGSGPSPASAPMHGEAPSRAGVALHADPAVAVANVPSPVLGVSEALQRPASAEARWFRFKGNPAIVVIEYPDLRTQGLAMNRLAALFEKRAVRRDRVLTDAELADLLRRTGDSIATFYQGHDYPAAKVARFFAQADVQGAALNVQERQLRSLLLEAGLLTRGTTGAVQAASEQAVISFTGVQDGPATLPDERVDSVRREAILRHELSHGEFFVDPAYHAHCMRFWREVLSRHERKVFTTYLKSLHYNARDEELMANETQALLMHTPDTRAFSAESLGLTEAALDRLRGSFRIGEPPHGLKD
jgi:hypothetical protein